MDISRLDNLYDYANLAKDEAVFAGREPELSHIAYVLTQSGFDRLVGYVAVCGQRAAGKTSVLNMVEPTARDRGFLWVSEADQRAASGIATRMPSRPASLGAVERARKEPWSPYEKIAVELRCKIVSGILAEGDFAPTEKQLVAAHEVSIGTAHRATESLKIWGFTTSSRGRRQ